jgi:UDP-glucuronate decarboxylase
MPDDFTGTANLGNLLKISMKQFGGKSKLVNARRLPVDDPLQRCPGARKT